MLTGSKIADSTTTSRFESETSKSAPPMTPASPSGPAGSAMRSVSGWSSRSRWSRVTRRSPGPARRTVIRPSGAARGFETLAEGTQAGGEKAHLPPAGRRPDGDPLYPPPDEARAEPAVLDLDPE